MASQQADTPVPSTIEWTHEMDRNLLILVLGAGGLNPPDLEKLAAAMSSIHQITFTAVDIGRQFDILQIEQRMLFSLYMG
ncbi:hypothetical protein CKM354_000192200 [Cercospora kikuchii]|uniref:Uncharacterized protein n=1 Tax=Cercospora kikuchii TaxID=84275 RepID=A0A9P3FDF4_9PEZI|nr:uncharacterized protein CKM354_000192200 [Cercospora kikuchii]GIZ38505.1 hypothetical protein CKM354_000192200 [Cercospora kikuchii]